MSRSPASTCVVARTLRDEFFAGMGLSWAMPHRLVDFLTDWRGLQGNHQVAAILKMVPYIYELVHLEGVK